MPLTPEQDQAWQQMVLNADVDFSEAAQTAPLRIPVQELEIDNTTRPIDLFESVNMSLRQGNLQREELDVVYDFFCVLLQAKNPNAFLRSMPLTEEDGVTYMTLLFPETDEPAAQ